MHIAVAVFVFTYFAVVSCIPYSPIQDIYTNSWAVKVVGGRDVADALAQKHGFQNLGKVGIFEDVYNFMLPEDVYHRETRSLTEPYREVTAVLNAESNVKFVEQQVTRKMVKKGYEPPTDPFWFQQWYLSSNDIGTLQEYSNETTQNLNVEPAWIQGITGCNVIVGVVDDGVEHTLPDLVANYDTSLDINVLSGRANAFPVSYNDTLDSHGTSCAGIIAMEKNNKECAVGVAYQSTVTGILLLGQGQTDIAEANALGHKDDIIDIYSNSWGPPDTGFIVQGPEMLAASTLELGAQQGRDKKGSIFVWAAGNGGDYGRTFNFGDSCAADGYVNSIYTIAIGSVGIDSRPAYYDERCSAKLAVTFVHNPFNGNLSVTTTDANIECTSDFDGTSAATPVASGAIALTLEANPDLTWRDVQYLIAYTSNTDILRGDTVETNAAGLKFSHHFGFGAIDAEAMVTRARHWINVPSQRMSSISVGGNGISTVDSNSTEEILAEFTGERIGYLEHVVVQVSTKFQGVDEDDYDYSVYYALYENLEHYYYNVTPNRGDIQIELTSPSGTTSTLLPYRLLDSWPGEYREWPFMSVHFWGEDPSGVWTLSVTNAGLEGTLEVSEVTITFYGTADTPEVIDKIPNQCDSACARGCAAEGPEFCDSCRNFRDAKTLECLDRCPEGLAERNQYCYDASQPEPVCVRDVPDLDTSAAASNAGGSLMLIAAVLVALMAYFQLV